MKVSVIIPLYNQGIFVSDAIESVFAQTYKNYEVICVNDASTDDSLQVVEKKYGDRIKIIDRQKNGGLPVARNTGISYSTGEAILPLDADDRIDPEHLQKTVGVMSGDPKTAIVSTWMQIFQLGRERCGPSYSSYPIFVPTPEQIVTGNSLTVCSLIRKQALLEAGGYPEDFLNGSEDWALWAAIICSRKWRAEVVPEYLFYYRVHRASMCRSDHMAPFKVSQARIQERYGHK